MKLKRRLFLLDLKQHEECTHVRRMSLFAFIKSEALPPKSWSEELCFEGGEKIVNGRGVRNLPESQCEEI